VDELLGRWALFQDNPDHRRIRQALTGAFTSSLMEQMRQRVQEIADGLIDAARGRGEMDLVADFALRLPAMVIAELLGMPSSDSERFQGWVHTIALYFAIGSLGNAETIAALRETVEQMSDYMREIVDDHRRAPKDDLIGSLIRTESQDEPLSEVEILSQCMLLLHGGYESTMNTISSGMLHILRDTDQRRLCAEDPGLSAAAVEEALRYEPAFQFVVLAAKLRRENGIDVSAGSRVMVTAGANMAFVHAVLAITSPGDEIILNVPFYFNHEMAIQMAGCTAVRVATDERYQPRLEALRAAITGRTRAIVTVTPNNPSGAVFSEEALRAINTLCGERGLYHIADEVYEYFTY